MQAVFPGAVETALSKTNRQGTLDCLDDIIVYPRPVKEHLVHLRIVLTLLQNARVTLQPSQWLFSGSTGSDLRHVSGRKNRKE